MNVGKAVELINFMQIFNSVVSCKGNMIVPAQFSPTE